MNPPKHVRPLTRREKTEVDRLIRKGGDGLISRSASIVERVWIPELRPVLSRAHELLVALMASDERKLHHKRATVARVVRGPRLPNSVARRIREIAARKSVVTAYGDPDGAYPELTR